jgi:hypothetical protein
MSVADLNQQFLTNVSNKKQQRFQENNDLIASGTKKLNELALRNTTKQETPVIQEEIKEPQVDMEKQRLAAVDRAIGTMEKEDYSQINPVEVTPVEIERMSPISETKPLERTPEKLNKLNKLHYKLQIVLQRARTDNQFLLTAKKMVISSMLQK